MVRTEGDLPVAVLFDFDGTILDTESILLSSWAEEYGAVGHSLTVLDWAASTGQAHVDHYERLASLVGADFDVEQCRARRRRRQAELLEHEPLRPGIGETLQTCAALAVRTAVVSSSPRSWLVEQLGRLGALSSFDVLVSGEDAALAKPHPDLYLVALQRLGVSASQAVAVEDAAMGAQAALAAGLLCVVVPNEVTRHSQFPAEAHRLDGGAGLWPFLLQSWATTQ